jgi:hypothetical protein
MSGFARLPQPIDGAAPHTKGHVVESDSFLVSGIGHDWVSEEGSNYSAAQQV